jgi:hypothetical protein
MKQQVTLYLPDALYDRCKQEAVKQGLSLSSYLTRQLSTTPSQIEQLQTWLASRLDQVEAALGSIVKLAQGNGAGS